MKNDEQFLLTGLRKGDHAAFKQLFDAHYAVLCRVAFAYLHDELQAQLIVDDLFVHLFEKRSTLIINTSVRPYLLRAVRNRCLNFLQTEYEQRTSSFSEIDDGNAFLQIEDTDEDPYTSLLAAELEDNIQTAIDRLPAECRRVFKLSRFENKTYDDIAAELGLSVNTVKYHIKSALARLYKDFKNYLTIILWLFTTLSLLSSVI